MLVEDSLVIDINQLLRAGLGDGRARAVSWESRGQEVASADCRLAGGRLMVMMVRTDKASGLRHLELHDIETTTSPCNYGGERHWLICPGRVKELEELGVRNFLGDGGQCGRRVSKLYRPPGSRRFLCRHCYDLRYLSQRASKDVVLARRAMAIKKRLGQEEPEQAFPPRPKGMHHRTYELFRNEYRVLNTASVYLTLKRFDLLDPSMQESLEGKNI
jgi:hypothetical protein